MKLDELPPELLMILFKYLTVKDLGKISCVCTYFNKFSLDALLWKDKLQSFSRIDNYSSHPKELVKCFFDIANQPTQPTHKYYETQGYCTGFSRRHPDYKQLILSTPELKNKLSDRTVKRIEKIDSFLC